MKEAKQGRKLPESGTHADPSSRDELLAEGEKVGQMIEFGGVVPERENLPYYIISIKWFTRWQKYTGSLKIDSDEDEDDGLHHKDKSKVILG